MEEKKMEMLVTDGHELTKKELVEWRQAVVAQGMLARKSVRRIQAELAKLAERGVGTPRSRGTVGHDMLVVRAKWATVRGAA